MRLAVYLVAGLLGAVPAAAQTGGISAIQNANSSSSQFGMQWQATPVQANQVGRIATSSVGEVGQRQAPEWTEGIVPTQRIANRIQNRVQSRIRNRIDRSYDPQANTIAPFAIAADQGRIVER